MRQPEEVSSGTEAVFALPLVWRLREHLPTWGEHLPSGPLRWPKVGEAVVVAERERAESAGWEGEPPDLLLAEEEGGAELIRLTEAAEEADVAAVLFAGKEVGAKAVSEARGLSRRVVILQPGVVGLPCALAQAARATEELVRRRVYRQLLASWHRRLAAHELALVKVGLPEEPWPPAGPPMAPLVTTLSAHVAGVVGLWWPGVPKPARALHVSAGKWRHLQTLAPAGLAQALHPRPRARSILVVEGDPIRARAAAIAFALVARRMGPELQLDIVTSARAARRYVVDHGPPDVAWVDVRLETPQAGLEFLAWLRSEQASTVVLGQSGGPTEEVRHELTRLGALAITGCEGLSPLARDVVGENVRLEQELEGPAARALEAAGHRAQALQAREVLQLLDADLRAFDAAGVGESTFHQVEAAAAREALRARHGNLAAAAGRLGVDAKRLRRILRARSGGRIESEP